MFVGRLIDLFAKDLLKSAQRLRSPYVLNGPFVPVWLRQSVVLLPRNTVCLCCVQTWQGCSVVAVALPGCYCVSVSDETTLLFDMLCLSNVKELANNEKLHPSFGRAASSVAPTTTGATTTVDAFWGNEVDHLTPLITSVETDRDPLILLWTRQSFHVQ